MTCICTVDHRLGVVSALLTVEAQKILHHQAGILLTKSTSMLIAVVIVTDIIDWFVILEETVSHMHNS